MSRVKFNKNDFKILGNLYSDGCTTDLKSKTLKMLSSETELSLIKVRVTMKNFLLANLCSEGAMDRNSKTYYITEEGVEYLLAATGDVEEIEKV